MTEQSATITPAIVLQLMRMRALTRGIDAADFDAVAQSVTDWPDWIGAWSKLGERDGGLAASCENHSWRLSASSAHLRSGAAYHLAKIMSVTDDEAYRTATLNSVSAVRRGLELANEDFARLEVPFDSYRIFGNLRIPPHVQAPPLVLFIGGADSVKEEFNFWEREFLARGAATLSMDGPGQGEAGFDLRIRPDYEVAVTAMLDAVAGEAHELDVSSVGAVGMSMGGYYSLRAAAFEPRIKAVVNNSGHYDLGASWDAGHVIPLLAAKLLWNFGASSLEEAHEMARALTLRPIVQRIQVPVLTLIGEADPLLDPEVDGEELTKDLPDGTLRSFPGGDHCLTNRIPQHAGPSADWLLEQLR